MKNMIVTFKKNLLLNIILKLKLSKYEVWIIKNE